MEFSRKKLAKDALSEMRVCPMDTVQPFVLMPAPVYVYMRANEKFVAVKAPLDFFTTEELKKLRPMDPFFLPVFIENTAHHRTIGRKIKGLLSWAETLKPPPAPYELSDALVRILAPAWTQMSDREIGVEPFLVVALINEVCKPIPEKLLFDAREKSVVEFERAILLSSWSVFTALHLGWCDLRSLSRLYRVAFLGTAFKDWTGAKREDRELVRAISRVLPEAPWMKKISNLAFEDCPERVLQKKRWRLQRVLRIILKVEEVHAEAG